MGTQYLSPCQILQPVPLPDTRILVETESPKSPALRCQSTAKRWSKRGQETDVPGTLGNHEVMSYPTKTKMAGQFLAGAPSELTSGRAPKQIPG